MSFSSMKQQDLAFECNEHITATKKRKRGVTIVLPADTPLRDIAACCGAERSECYALGVLPNEIEHSANMFFGDGVVGAVVPVIDVPDTHTFFRCYYSSHQTLHYDETRISREPFAGATDEHVYEIILRLDFAPKNPNAESHEALGKLLLWGASAKLRVMRDVVKVGGIALRLTAAIEAPYGKVTFDDTPGSKMLLITCWYVRFLDAFVFRLAVRRTLNKTPDCHCNVECENPIERAAFAELFNLLYRYVARSLSAGHGIRMRADTLASDMSALPDLTDFQRTAAASVQLLSDNEEGGGSAVAREAHDRLERAFREHCRVAGQPLSEDQMTRRNMALVRRLGAEAHRSYESADRANAFAYREDESPYGSAADAAAAAGFCIIDMVDTDDDE